MKEGFTAAKCTFNGVPGFMVSQWYEGKEIVKQFIPEIAYKDFCTAAGVQPELIN